MWSIGLSLALATGTAWGQQQDTARASEYAGASFDAKTSADAGSGVEPASKSISTKGVSSTKPGRSIDAAAQSAPKSISEPGVAPAKPQGQATGVEPASKSISEKGVSATKSRRNE
jgi:hypothetical protein